MNHRMTWTAMAVLAASSLLGCEHPTPPPPPPPPAPKLIPDSRVAATAMLVEHVKALGEIVAQMPGSGGAVHRQLLVSALGQLSIVLQSADGSVQSPEFATRIRVIDAATKTAGVDDLPRQRMEAVENQALDSASKALNEITSRYLFDDDQLPPMLELVNKNVEVADDAVGPMHDLDATEAFRSIQSVAQRMSEDLVARFGNIPGDQTAAPAPVQAPSAAPATMPS